MDRTELADFLRRRREQLVPADVGLPPGVRRRTPGLRRDEVALLAGMSTDYYTRLEQARGPHPSTSVLGSLARALRLTDDQRDHLYLLSGQVPPLRAVGDKHVGPGLLHLLDKLDDTPSCVISDLGEVLLQNRMHVALFGDLSTFSGLDRYLPWRYFVHPGERSMFPEEEHERLAANQIADLRATAARRAGDADVTELVTRLRERSPEFAALWDRHDVAVRRSDTKSVLHAEVGRIDLVCETLLTPSAYQHLLVYLPQPGSDARARLDVLRVIGTQQMV
ncbi:MULTISPECIES: helix-turn-helix transcriptional regulator [Rhodococcus]|uniref:Helix-turn-helix transcriptional regulator n=1 Tax=Rhodococcus oxybenzonivorans TaxID=1990687 RepID=A0AAE4V2C8_9NOCA|nr:MULTISPECIES: helix-turn-helix transcriptional regulator [Rhodococcus]MDV7245060.1 helix-turn-helix transcriptional regulator [Rhodococcus oxybenzonivorans]MDV7266884.1 helix-turn-helix transcriptional regulator [Rhodococcus oxybenzonivorans]MDV7272657.1 helix-turn-helix transcriptional regulator [Rhodococcus oxybenzonivorans]MDV7336085.1 helix-turn-helix transcriptional regulator [Rhodococcus oxybenzonivorans]MDV7342772.1 helix-turn-helix transcriptional regulator [Rhodococcus oxybenzonivo